MSDFIPGDLSRFSPWFDRIFFREVLNPSFSLQDAIFSDFRNVSFVLENCIVDFDTEQAYLKLQATNFKNDEVTANPSSRTRENSERKKT